MGSKRFVITFLLGLLAWNLKSEVKLQEQDKFTVIGEDLSTSVTSGDLRFVVRVIKPSTVPASTEPENWKLVLNSAGSKKLFGINGQLQKRVFKTNTGEVSVETWISEEADLMAFRQAFTNKSGKIVRLNNIYPLYIRGTDNFEFGTTSDWRILEQFRHKNDMPKTEVPVASGKVNCDPFFIINNYQGEGKNLFVGYQTFYLHLADISISFDPDLELDNIKADCDFESVEVPADGTRTSQWVIISAGDDADRMIDNYTQRLRAFYDFKEPLKNAPSVYCTWYYHADNYNEEIFRKDIVQFRKEHLPFDVFLIDECWDVDDWGDFEANSSFPSGMKWAAGEINSTGYTAGIWTAPFLADEESDLVKQHPGWLLKNSKGVRCTFNMNNRDHFILDLTYPGVCDYLEEQFRKISQEWGYKYFKFDFMRSVFLDSDQQFYDKSATSLEAYRRGLEAIRRGTGKDAYISVCGGHYGASFGIADTQRSGSDVKSQWNETELPKYRQNILRTWMGGLWHVDPDAMMVRRQVTAEPNDRRNLTTGLFSDQEAFTNTLNQFLGGNLITFTEDFTKIDADRKMLYKYVIPSVNSPSRPLDLFNTKCPEIMITAVTPLCKKLDGWNMLSVINWSDQKKTYSIPFNDGVTGNLKGDRFLVFDFQSQEIIALVSKGEALKIQDLEGHNSKLLKIVPWDGVSPMFIGTDLNFSCGGLEVSDLDFNNGCFTGSLDTEWHVPVKLSFVIPYKDGYQVKRIITQPGQMRFIAKFD